MGLTTKTINSSLLGKKMNIAVCVPDAYENIPFDSTFRRYRYQKN